MDRADIIKAVARLPQAKHLPVETVNAWIDGVRRVDPDRLEWHLRRAGGFGGSDMGALIAGFEGRYHVFNSAREIVSGKLFRSLPDGETVDTRRGTELEPFIQKLFERRMTREGRSWTRREDYMETLQNTPHPSVRWHQSSPDDIIEVDGETWLVDYKAPTQDMLDHYRKALDFTDYEAQLHHYRHGAVGRGIKIDRMVLSMYDYKSNDVELFEIEHNPELDRQLIEIGDHYWDNYVLKGEVPAYAPRRVEVEADDAPANIKDDAQKWIWAKAIGDAAAMVAADKREAVEAWAQEQGHLGDVTMTFAGLMQVKAKDVFDLDAAVVRLLDLGLSEAEMDCLRKPSSFSQKGLETSYSQIIAAGQVLLDELSDAGTVTELVAKILEEAIASAAVKKKGDFDPDLVSQKLEELGERSDRFRKESFSSGFPRGKSQDLSAFREEVRNFLDDAIRSLAPSENIFSSHSESDVEAFPPIQRFAF